MTHHEDGSLRVLLIGPLPPAEPTASNPVGGAAVNFAEMVRQLQRRDLHLDLVDLTRPRVNLQFWRLWRNNVATFLKLISQVARRLRCNDVVFLNISSGKAWVIGSCIWIICIVVRRPMVLRFFGGDFVRTYDRYGPLRRWWVDLTYMRCGLVFVQTQEILSRFLDHRNFRWFPNTRDIKSYTTGHRQAARRLLFVSQLRMEKGLRETLEACRDLPEMCHLTVYGPPMPNTDWGLFDGHPRATYGGVLSPGEIPKVLAHHDVLVAPSYWDGEGHPGIILEALQCGRPVIATWWGSIPEVIEHEKSGLLVEPRSAPEVKAAIGRLLEDPELYQRLCKGAQCRGEFFRSGTWYNKMMKELYDLSRRWG